MQNTKEILWNENLKATPSRIRLLELFSKSKQPISMKEIIKEIGFKTIDEATIYRTLEVFKEKGLIRQIDFRKDHAYYELANSDHHHLVCNSCGRIEDFEGCKELINRVLRRSKQFSKVSQHSLELFGLCKQCA
jgi:Fe2+ or Zn2+ uptake regulation protein